MLRAGLGLLVLLVMLPSSAWAGSCGGVADSCQCGKNNPYPCCNNGGGKSGNCTWGAWHQACCHWGKGLPGWGNAGMWAGNAAAHPDYEVHSGPVVNSVAVRVTGANGYGHVAWVTGVGGGSVTVTQQACCSVSPCYPNCSWCINGFYGSSHPAGHFNGGYVTPKGAVWVCQPGQGQSTGCGNCGTKTRTCKSNGQWGGWGSCNGQGVCAPGAGQSEACGDCGTHSRGCQGNCQWGAWGACSGPDPEGGGLVCDSGQLGLCMEGRVRCVGGWKQCVALHEPAPELCDGLDNDCNGETDNGNPQVLGDPPPAHAARLVDLSFSKSMLPGQSAIAWVDFMNLGTQSWEPGDLWLTLPSADAGCPLAPAGRWPAWDTPAVLKSAVDTGQCGRLEFPVQAPVEPGMYEMTLVLQGPDGQTVRCPEASVHFQVKVGLPAELHSEQPDATSDASVPPAGKHQPTASGSEDAASESFMGCNTDSTSGAGNGGALVVIVLLALLALSQRVVRYRGS